MKIFCIFVLLKQNNNIRKFQILSNMAKPSTKKFVKIFNTISSIEEECFSEYAKTQAEIKSLRYKLIEEFFEQIGDKKFLNMAATVHSQIMVNVHNDMITFTTEPRDGNYLRFDVDEIGTTLWAVNEYTKFATVLETFSWE